MLVTFSKGFQLSSAALKFSSWQHPPSHRFHEQWQWVYFLFYTQPFPELAVMGLTLLRDTVSQQNSSVQSSKHWVSTVVENMFVYKKPSYFSRRKKQLSRCFSPTKLLFQAFIWLTSFYQRLYYHLGGDYLISEEKIKKIKTHCSDSSSTTTDISAWGLQGQSCKLPSKCWEYIIVVSLYAQMCFQFSSNILLYLFSPSTYEKLINLN